MRADIGGREAMAIAFFYGAAETFLGMPREMVQGSGEAAWMSVVLAGLVAVGAYCLVARLLLAFPHGGLVDALQQGLGGGLGFCAAFLFFALFVFEAAIVTREFVGQIQQTVLPLTPVPMLTISFLLAAGYAAMTGIEGLGRGAWFAMPWVCGGTLLLAVLSLEWAHVYNLLPLLGRGPAHVARVGLQRSGLLGDLVLAVVAFEVRPRRAILAAGVRGYLLATVLAVSAQLALGLDFDRVAVSTQPYPLYQLAKLIAYGRFFQRLESIFVFVWIVAALFRIALDVYLAATVFARAAGLPRGELLVPAVAALVYGGAVSFPSWSSAYRLDGRLFQPWSWMLFVVALLLLGAALLGQRAKARAARRGA